MAIWERIRNEPAMVMALINAAIMLAASFGVTVTDGQWQAIIAVAAAVILILTGVPVRQAVTPNSNVLQAKRKSKQ